MEASALMIVRIILIFLGIVVLGVGMYSHFSAGWNADEYEACQKYENSLEEEGSEFKTCPHIGMEYGYLAVISVTFPLCFALLIVSCVIHNREPPYTLIDVWCHVIVAILLLGGAALFITSTVMVNNIYRGKVENDTLSEEQGIGTTPIYGRRRKRAAGDAWEPMDWEGGPVGRAGAAAAAADVVTLFPVKLAAGAMTVVEAILALITAWLARAKPKVAPAPPPKPEPEPEPEPEPVPVVEEEKPPPVIYRPPPPRRETPPRIRLPSIVIPQEVSYDSESQSFLEHPSQCIISDRSRK